MALRKAMTASAPRETTVREVARWVRKRGAREMAFRIDWSHAKQAGCVLKRLTYVA